MKSKLRRKLPKIMANLSIGLILIIAVSLAGAIVYIAFQIIPIPTRIICLGITSYIIAKKLIRLFVEILFKMLNKAIEKSSKISERLNDEKEN